MRRLFLSAQHLRLSENFASIVDVVLPLLLFFVLMKYDVYDVVNKLERSFDDSFEFLRILTATLLLQHANRCYYL